MNDFIATAVAALLCLAALLLVWVAFTSGWLVGGAL